MEFLNIEPLTQFAPWSQQFFLEPLRSAPWAEWRSFWQRHILDDRFPGFYFLAAVPILLLLSRRRLRAGIIAASVVCLAYVFGALYLAFWLAMCAAFYWLAERFAVEAKRKDVLRWGPPLAAIAIIGVWYVVTLRIHTLTLPSDLNAWLFHNTPWLFPLGLRKLPWEFYGVYVPADVEQHPVQLFRALFVLPQINGLVIFTIRMIHYFSELKRDAIPQARRSFGNFLAYVCYFPTLIQGPIERFSEFQDEMDTCHERRCGRNVARGLARIALGLIKSIFCTLYLFPLLAQLILVDGYYWQPRRVESALLLVFGIHLNVLWLYLEFSGCCDVAAGTAHLLGYRQIENFRLPWLATSMRDFWRRWHISFSFILRDYIYIPLGGGRRRATLNVFITFIICALLHNLNPNFLLWGIVIGLMVVIHRAWERWMKRLDEQPASRLGTVRRAWLKLAPLPRICAWAVTQNAFVASCLVIVAGLESWRLPWEMIRRGLAWLARACGLDLPALY